ncbi:hypothetical protein GF325_15275, partial [Candidatus Bathyarchaeota archaeon]|nr:hypothetical protein [Candidatus Bathyarchaeota archaeon]
EALLTLKANYEHFKGALQVRNVYEDYWVLELKEIFTRDVEEFYIEDEAYSRSEVMTLAFIAYSQPVPKRVLRFYRGNAASTHARKWLRAGFLESKTITRGDPVLSDLLERHGRDKNARLEEMEARIEEEIEKLKEKNDAESIQVDARDLARKKTKRKKRREKPTDRLECFITTPKFSGYFNLPGDVSTMKCELEEWRSICDMLD